MMMQIRQNTFYALPIGVAYSGSYTLDSIKVEKEKAWYEYGIRVLVYTSSQKKEKCNAAVGVDDCYIQ